ncbi:MAG: MTH1187 family thiamine-binding protein [Halobacteriaceae archaeon]
MTVTASLTVAPLLEGDLEAEIANALDALEDYDVEYETHPMETTIWCADIGELFDAVEAAHRAVTTDRVVTRLKIDDMRDRELADADEKVEMVEAKLGRPARSSPDPDPRD